MLYFTAAASKGSPSWNLTPRRTLITSPIRSSVHLHSVASCGTISSSSPISNSRSHVVTDDSAREGPAQRRVESVQVCCEADAQGLRRRCAGKHRRSEEENCNQCLLFDHFSCSLFVLSSVT